MVQGRSVLPARLTVVQIAVRQLGGHHVAALPRREILCVRLSVVAAVEWAGSNAREGEGGEGQILRPATRQVRHASLKVEHGQGLDEPASPKMVAHRRAVWVALAS